MEDNARKPYVIGHKDGDLRNNHANNLEWFVVPVDVSDGAAYEIEDTIRSVEEIQAYEIEACDKVWLMRTHPVENYDIEQGRIQNVERILNTYQDIPEDEYTTWESGYWNGIMAALRWVLGSDRDFLDT